MDITLSYGRRGLGVRLPDANVRQVLRFHRLAPVERPEAAVRHALRFPIGCPPLRELALGRRDACLVTSDITRPVPNALLISAVLSELRDGGLPPERVTILVGTGLHRPNTPEELREMLGDEVLDSGVRVVNHVARDADGQVHLGETPRGTPVYVDRAYVEADLKLAVSLVEPHLMAGFSGGRKALCPGICGMETIRRFHGPALLDPAEACAGLLDGNPVHEESLAVAMLAGPPDLTVNVTLNESRELTGVFAGELVVCHRAAVRRSVEQSKVAIPAPVDLVVTTNAGHPLDLTFYQGVKGMIAAVPILKPGGTILIAHECAEGIGGPEFTALTLGLSDPHEYIRRTWDPQVFTIDQWQLHEQVKVLRHAGEVLSVSGGVPAEQLAQCHVTPVASVEEGVERALRKHGSDAAIAVIPEGPYVLACLEGDRIDRQRV
ncbi:MAG: nickel-dependent lactate racemase [Armatimonadetes bacterium]|nr:nickel-dependent lactate racemase [Armatimonadota bacterium]